MKKNKKDNELYKELINNHKIKIKVLVFISGDGYNNNNGCLKKELNDVSGVFEVSYENKTKVFSLMNEAIYFYDSLYFTKSFWDLTTIPELLNSHDLIEIDLTPDQQFIYVGLKAILQESNNNIKLFKHNINNIMNEESEENKKLINLFCESILVEENLFVV